jgi:hypothetical protein
MRQLCPAFFVSQAGLVLPAFGVFDLFLQSKK